MARKRTGTLILKPWGYAARVRFVDENGKRVRKQVALNTRDPLAARRALDKLVRDSEQGARVAALVASVDAPELNCDAWSEFLASSEARGVQIKPMKSYWDNHIADHLGPIPCRDTRRSHCIGVLDKAVAAGLQRNSVKHVRSIMVRFFNWLEAHERIERNPMRGVKAPSLKKSEKPARMTEIEFSALMQYAPDLGPSKRTGRPRTAEVEIFETQIMAYTSRVLGGLRGGECLAWDWSLVDLDGGRCEVRRAAKGPQKEVVVQPLTIHPTLATRLREWWQLSGCPASGPVFPISRGHRKGQARVDTNLAKRLRTALRRALTWAGLPLRRELFEKVPGKSRPANFHGIRKEYVTAVVGSGVNEAQSMALANHHDPRVHRIYQHNTFTDLPESAVPVLVPLAARVAIESRKPPFSSGENAVAHGTA